MTALLTISIVWLSINKGQKFEGENRDRAANHTQEMKGGSSVHTYIYTVCAIQLY